MSIQQKSIPKRSQMNHRMKYLLLPAVLTILVLVAGCGSKSSTETRTGEASTEAPSILTSPDDIRLTEEADGSYRFTYGQDTFRAEFRTDTWKILDSYRITNLADMTLICKALNDLRPVPTPDRKGTRTPEDLAFEWDQHNLAFTLLPDGDPRKDRARDVDLNPEDQGKSLMDFAMEDK